MCFSQAIFRPTKIVSHNHDNNHAKQYGNYEELMKTDDNTYYTN